jgi:hypothetical protein
MNQMTAYLALNACFAVLVAGGTMSAPGAAAHPLYLIPLFALCSSSFIGMRRLNDRYALLVLFSAMYFMTYGIVDVLDMFAGNMPAVPTRGLFSMTEGVILVGGAMVHLGYRLVCRRDSHANVGPATDWPERTLVLFGGALWIVCTLLSWEFKVNVLVDQSVANAASGLAKVGLLKSTGFIIAVMAQPLGILMLAYAQSRYRRPWMRPMIVGVVLIQLAYGFVIDVKGDALAGAVLVILTKLLVDNQLPKGWIVAMAAFIVVAFPVMQANRIVRGESGMDRIAAAKNIGEVLKRAVSRSQAPVGEGEGDRIFLGRASMKPYVEMIVARTGKDVEFQNGYTLSPLLTMFIPRIVWPTKPDVQAGLLVNSVFQLSDSPDTYISPSHLGELYWNFGWAGAVVGMLSIGLLLGYVASRFTLDNAVTLTRIMIAIVTLRLLVIGFESSIAAQYTVWIRSMCGIGLLHLLFAKQPAAIPGAARQSSPPQPTESPAPLRFPHLMR